LVWATGQIAPSTTRETPVRTSPSTRHRDGRRDHRCDEDLVALARDGDDAALRELVDRFRPQVAAKARTYFLVGGDRQDVVQEGMIGLYKAVRDYDRSRHPSFRHFADLCVTRQVITAVKGATRHKHAPLNRYVSLQAPATTGEGDEGEAAYADRLADDAADPAHAVAGAAEVAELRAFCRQVLSEMEAEVLARYVAGDSYAQIADELGRHTKAIDNAVQRIKRKLEVYVAAHRTDAVV
jgi:RNA polymerase sporulation-specific sigma factor